MVVVGTDIVVVLLWLWWFVGGGGLDCSGTGAHEDRSEIERDVEATKAATGSKPVVAVASTGRQETATGVPAREESGRETQGTKKSDGVQTPGGESRLQSDRAARTRVAIRKGSVTGLCPTPENGRSHPHQQHPPLLLLLSWTLPWSAPVDPGRRRHRHSGRKRYRWWWWLVACCWLLVSLRWLIHICGG